MAVTFEPLYGGYTSIAITSAASLANGSYAGSAVVDNSTNLYQDAHVGVTVATGGSGFTSASYVRVYAYGLTDGTHYTDGATGTDAAQTPTSPTNLKLLGTVVTPANSTTYYDGPFAVAPAFGGVLPKKWGVVLQNVSGSGALASSGTSLSYAGLNNQIP